MNHLKTSYIATLFCILLLTTANCGSDGGSKTAGLDLNMPTALLDLNLEALRVSGSVWSVNDDGVPVKEASAAKDAVRTIRGNYALPVDGLHNGRDYQFLVKIYYQADEYVAPSISGLKKANGGSDEEGEILPVGISTDFSSCPGLNLTPDSSLAEGGTWLLLCDISITTTFDSSELIEIGEDEIVCNVDGHDADGDGMANLTEIDSSVDPFNGDYDGDCVADDADAFPADPDESVDTDGDGIGDNSDSDADNDSLTNEQEAAIGTEKLDSDTDDDGYTDGSDNCPIVANADQLDTDGNGTGDACEGDDDGDGLTDEQEAAEGSSRTDPDSDNDGWNDGYEVNTSETSPINADTDGDGYFDYCADNPDTNTDECEDVPVDAFPLDPTEWADSDSDSKGDNSDNCLTNANPDQLNTDLANEEAMEVPVILGNACDTDDDSDGLPDTVETPEEARTDPLNPDTDGDGLTDWFGGAQSPGHDPCPLNALGEANHSDGDGDGFGVGCDCNDGANDINPAIGDEPDIAGVDENCDGVDGDVDEAIFVSITTGDDDNDGSLENPLATIQAGGSAAVAAEAAGDGVRRDVYVADGTYTLADTYSLPDGVMFYGGYSIGFAARRDTDETTITTSTENVLIEAAGTGAGTGLDRFILENKLETADSPVAVEVTNADLSLSNCEILASNSLHATGIDAIDSTLNLKDNNPIRVFGGSNVGVGVLVDGVTGSFEGNSIQVENFVTTRIAISCVSAGEENITLKNNRLDVWPGVVDENSDNPLMIYIRDCSGTQHWSADPFDAFPFSGFTDGGGNSFDGV